MEPTTTDAQSQLGSVRAAETVLRRVFARVNPGIQYRLWDGTEGRVGSPDGSFTLVIRDPETFGEAFSSGNTRALAEAFVENRLDVEGSLFNSLRVGNQLDEANLGLWDKFTIWRALRRVTA